MTGVGQQQSGALRGGQEPVGAQLGEESGGGRVDAHRDLPPPCLPQGEQGRRTARRGEEEIAERRRWVTPSSIDGDQSSGEPEHGAAVGEEAALGGGVDQRDDGSGRHGVVHGQQAAHPRPPQRVPVPVRAVGADPGQQPHISTSRTGRPAGDVGSRAAGQGADPGRGVRAVRCARRWMTCPASLSRAKSPQTYDRGGGPVRTGRWPGIPPAGPDASCC